MIERNVEDDYNKKTRYRVDAGKYFTVDIGDNEDGLHTYLRGPVVITFLSRGAELTVYHGAPWDGETVEGITIRGDSFTGQLLVGKNEYAVGRGKACLLSGFEVDGKKKKK